jgi:hypothetical protein
MNVQNRKPLAPSKRLHLTAPSHLHPHPLQLQPQSRRGSNTENHAPTWKRLDGEKL